MTKTIKHYAIKLHQENKIGKDQTLKTFKTNRIAAYRWLINNKNKYDKKDINIYVEEKEYACEENIKKDLTLYTCVLWSNQFHGYEKLKEIMMPRSEKDFDYHVEKTTNDGSIWYITYKKQNVAAFGTETYKPKDSALIENAKLTIKQCLNNPTTIQEQQMQLIDESLCY